MKAQSTLRKESLKVCVVSDVNSVLNLQKIILLKRLDVLCGRKEQYILNCTFIQHVPFLCFSIISVGCS